MGKLGAIMGKDAVMRFGGALDYISHTHGKHAPPRHWYLMIVGVHPDVRGRGLGAALLAPVLKRADAEKVPVCLDTAQPKVGPLYARLGFRQTQESVDPASGARFWAYQRDPI
jgi:GNAT superfamily N-acetyltransferase